jgi:hypothetical protein
MQTRQAMIYDFMVALSGNPNIYDFIPLKEDFSSSGPYETIYRVACGLADQYLKGAV